MTVFNDKKNRTECKYSNICKDFGTEFCLNICSKISKDTPNNAEKEVKVNIPVISKKKYSNEKIQERQISKKTRNVIIVVIITTILFTSSIYIFGLLTDDKSFLSNIMGVSASKDIELYNDKACTTKMNSLDWGTIYPGENITRNAYIRNIGNDDVTLEMETLRWKPQILSNYLTVTWNYQNQIVKRNELIQVTWTLISANNIPQIDAFSVTIRVKSIGL